MDQLAPAVQDVTGEQVELAYVDQGYTGDEPEHAAAMHGIRLDVVKLSEAKRGFVLLPLVATPLGGRAQLRLDGALPPPRPRLRAAGGNLGGFAFSRLCLSLVHQFTLLTLSL